MLATNQLQFVEGAISANLFNGVLQGLPVKIGIDTKKKNSKKLVINTVFLLVSNYIESGNFPFFNS